MPTKQNVIDIFLRRHPDASSQSAEYFERAYRWAVVNLPIQRAAKTIDMADNQWEYDLPAGELVEFEQVIYATGVDAQGDYQGTPLAESTIEQMTALSEEQITDLAEGGVPGRFALVNVQDSTTGKPQIWIWPRYNGTPAGGYPKLVIWGRWYVALAATSTNLPAGIPDETLIVAKMKQFYLEDFPDVEGGAINAEAEADRKLQQAQSFHRNRSSQDHWVLSPSVLTPGRRTV